MIKPADNWFAPDFDASLGPRATWFRHLREPPGAISVRLEPKTVELRREVVAVKPRANWLNYLAGCITRRAEVYVNARSDVRAVEYWRL
jgi:hypothetical protein